MSMITRAMRESMQKTLAWHIEVLVDTLSDATDEDREGLRCDILEKYALYKKLGGVDAGLEERVKAAVGGEVYDATQG